MSTPDLTPAQLVSALGAILTVLVTLFKLNISDVDQAAVLAAAGVIVPTAWVIADSVIRHGRSSAQAAAHNLAAAQIASTPPDGVDRAPAA